jgi:purine-nucleoside phosphorylase
MTSARAAGTVKRWLAGDWPDMAVVLGSGMGQFTGRLTGVRRLPYSAVPGFAGVAVPGHAGELVLGRLGGELVLCQSGRFHGYEGHDAATVALPVRMFAELGIGTLVLTNAAGGIRRDFRPGTLMLIADQINLTFTNPLFGPRAATEPRFPDMAAPFDAELMVLARSAARAAGVPLAEGVYAGVMGPSYETAAEIRMLERMGADAVGMSTVLEVVAARARGMRCLGISVIANAATGLAQAPLSHEEVTTAGRAAADGLGAVVAGVVRGLQG